MLEKFVNHRTLANVLMLSFIGLGLYALPRLQKETFPRFDSSEIQIAMTYRGASAEDVEQGICLPIEDALDGVQNIKKVTCTAQEGAASIVVEIQEGADVAAALNDIETEVEAISDLPEGAEDLIVTELNRTDSVMTITVSGPLDEDSLKDYCEQFKQQLKRLPGVSLVEIQGFSDRQLRIELDTDALRRLGLSAATVSEAVRSQNLDIPLGTIESENEPRKTSKRSSSTGCPDGPRSVSVTSAESSIALPTPNKWHGSMASVPASFRSTKHVPKTPVRSPTWFASSFRKNGNGSPSCGSRSPAMGPN